MKGTGTPPRILVVDDDADVLGAARMLFEERSVAVVTLNRPDRILKTLEEDGDIDAILLDLNFRRGDASGAEGMEWIEKIARRHSDLPIVCLTAYGDVEIAVEAMRRGAVDFVMKPWENEKLAATVNTAIKLRRSQRESDDLKRRAAELARSTRTAPIVGTSAAYRKVMDLVARVAPTEANVFITGENGVGKEVLAREVHRLSRRSAAPFVSVDLGAVPDHLAESELFGHRRGAYTDAREHRLGRFAAADGGTLFLDEVANASASLQAKLLAAVERREIVPVGGDERRPIDVRLISATNARREVLMDPSAFRRDLLHRLKTIEIEIPPLRERREDITPLIAYFAEEFARRHAKPARLPDESALDELKRYRWPGNVRELKHAVERAVLLADGCALTARDFGLPSNDLDDLAPDGERTRLVDLEREALVKALRRHGGNVTRAAAELGLTRASLYRRMEKYGV